MRLWLSFICTSERGYEIRFLILSNYFSLSSIIFSHHPTYPIKTISAVRIEFISSTLFFSR